MLIDLVVTVQKRQLSGAIPLYVLLMEHQTSCFFKCKLSFFFAGAFFPLFVLQLSSCFIFSDSSRAPVALVVANRLADSSCIVPEGAVGGRNLCSFLFFRLI